MSRGRPVTKPEKAAGGDLHAEWIVALGALAFIAIGLLVAVIFHIDSAPAGPPKPQYVGFKDLKVTAQAGRMEVSFDLQVSRDDVSRVSSEKRLLEAELRNDLRNHDPRAFYSRAGKERLASLIQQSANRALGDDIVEEVYFGDFKIFER
jgi:flagellar basal body-associated protein FliL